MQNEHNAQMLNVSVVDEQEEKFADHQPSEKEQEVVRSVVYKFRKSADERNKPLDIFDGLNLREYVDESFRRYNTSVDKREDVEDWQSIMHDPMTRNKQNAILGRIITQMPIGQIGFKSDKDVLKASILNDIYQVSEDMDRYEMKVANLFLDAATNGTAVWYEGHRFKPKQFRHVVNGENGTEIETEVEVQNQLYGESVPITEFYPSSISIETIAEMPYCFRRQIIDFQTFRQDYAAFDRASNVQPYTGTETDTEPEPFHLQHISRDVDHGYVEVIKYYNQDVSEYVIVANGVWINPIVTTSGEEISPLPYEHGKLPFTEIKYELIGSGIFYGKSFPDRVGAMQDVLNALNNMLLDQAFLSVWPIIITNGIDSVEDDWIRPGRRIPIDTQGMPIDQAYSRLDLGVPTGFHQWITEYTRKIIEESSVDRPTQGVAGVGGRTTAQEIRVAAQGVTNMLGMFGRYVNDFVVRKAEIRAKNILQFWTLPDSPIVKMEGSAEDFNKAFNSFQRDDVSLEDGTRGTRIIEMFSDQDSLPTQAETEARADAFEIETGRKIEIVAITPKSIRDLQFSVTFVPHEKTQENRDVKLSLEIEKVRMYMSFFPELINQEELLANIAVQFGDDPAKIIRQEVLNPEQQQQREQAMEQEQMGELSMMPESNVANNMLRGERGGMESPMQQ